MILGALRDPNKSLLRWRIAANDDVVAAYAPSVANDIAPTANAEINSTNAKNPNEDARKVPSAIMVPIATNIPATEMPSVTVERSKAAERQ